MAAAFTRDTLEAGNPAPSGNDITDGAGPSRVRPAGKRTAAEPHSREPTKKASKTTEREAKQCQKANERAITKAQREADEKARSLQTSEPASSQPFSSQPLELHTLQHGLQMVAWSPDGAM